MHTKSCLALLAVLWVVPSCGATVDTSDDMGGTTQSGTTDGNGASSAEATETDAATGDPQGDAETTAEEPVRLPAKGIEIEWVEANQGVGVRIGEDGAQVGPSDRTAFLLSNRIALVRGFWKVGDNFEAREIVGELHLTFPDGTTEILRDTKLVEGDSFVGDLDLSFNWGIMAEQAQPGLRYHVELWEKRDVVDDGSYPESALALPLDGTEGLVGIEESYQVLKVTIVPFNYDDGADCVSSPDTSKQTMQLFYDLMFMMNPVEDLQIELHDPIDWNQPLESFSELNSFMSELRFEENAPPETYYYGLVDVCSGGLGGAGGQAFGIPSDPTSMEAAFQRVSSGVSVEPDFSAETFVHEVGHSQGRRHVACDGEGGPDPSYPFEGGVVGEWGFGVIDFVLRHPTVYKDYMTYCNPAWVSTWGWNKTYPVIQALSAWDTADASTYLSMDTLLVGVTLPSGREIWHTVPGRVPAASSPASDVTVEFRAAGHPTVTREAYVSELPDARGEKMTVVPLPYDFETIERVTRIEGDRVRQIPRSAIRTRASATKRTRGPTP